MKLYLLRHGQALGKQQDPQRGLSAEGQAEVLRLGKKLAEKNVHPDKIVHSGKARAQQTAEIIRDAIAPDIKMELCEHINPDDDPATLLQQISGWKTDTLVVSHLPFIPELLGRLCPDAGYVSFTTASIACLEQKDTHWELLWVEKP